LIAEKNKKELLLFSGGLDSYIAWHYLGKPQWVYARLGHRYESYELEAITLLCKLDKSLENSWYRPEGIGYDFCLPIGKYFEEGDANIPLRNLYLVSLATNLGFNTIYLVCQEGEREIPDRSDAFFEMTSELLSLLSNRETKVNPVFVEMSKVDMVEWYLAQDLPVKYLKKTRSCYAGDSLKKCGNCSACIRRYIAFTLNGIEENYKGTFEMHPRSSMLYRAYISKAQRGLYTGKRQQEIIRCATIDGLNKNNSPF